MKKQYLMNSMYADMFVSLTGRSVELTMDYMQLLKKDFKVEGLNKEYDPYYWLSLGITFVFEIKKFEENEYISLSKIRGSILATERSIDQIEKNKYEEYPITAKLSDYIKKNYEETIGKLKYINIQESSIKYEIMDFDFEEIKNSVKYIDEIFKNETEINTMAIEFDKNDSLKKALDIYRGYSIIREIEELKESLIVTENKNLKAKKIKL